MYVMMASWMQKTHNEAKTKIQITSAVLCRRSLLLLLNELFTFHIQKLHDFRTVNNYPIIFAVELDGTCLFSSDLRFSPLNCSR